MEAFTDLIVGILAECGMRLQSSESQKSQAPIYF